MGYGQPSVVPVRNFRHARPRWESYFLESGGFCNYAARKRELFSSLVLFAEAVRDQLAQRVHGGRRIFADRLDRDGNPGTGGEHHQSHD